MSNEAHAILSASGSKRWLLCPGSIKMCRGIKEPPSSYAQIGTCAHGVSEGVLRDGLSADDAFASQTGYHKLLIKEDVDMDDFWNAVNTYIDWVREQIAAYPGAKHAFEQRGDLGFIAPNMFGTSDYSRVVLFDSLLIGDYKHGQGIVVEVNEGKGKKPKVEDANSQVAYYGLASAHRYAYNFETITLAIIQPRAPHVEGPIRTVTYDMEEFREVWTEKFKEGVIRVGEANEANNIMGHLNPSDDACRFCAARATCPAVHNKTMELAKLDFAAVEPMVVDPATLTPAQIAVVLNHSGMIDSWIKAVAEHAFNLVDSGTEVPGYKITNKRSYRKWIDEKKVLTSLKRRKALEPKDFMTEPELLSAPKIEKKMKKQHPKVWAALQQHIHKVSSGKTLTKEDDARPALEHQKASDDFDAVEGSAG